MAEIESPLSVVQHFRRDRMDRHAGRAEAVATARARSALLTHAFGALHERGMRRMALGVDAENPTGATRVYERAGMRVSQHYATYSKELRAGIDLADVGEDG